MGYACPVCDAEQADAEHLANHLAITASLGRKDHEAWLEEYAPDWGDCNPAELGERIAPHAPEIETPDFNNASHGHDHGRPGGLEGGIAQQSRQPGRGSMTSGAEDILQEAAELTERMQGDAAEDGDDQDAREPGEHDADNGDEQEDVDEGGERGGADGTTENENA